MPKKSVSQSSPEKKSHSELLNEKLVENFVQLQKVNTSLVERIDKLSNQLSELLALFEKAARSFAENPSVQHRSTEKDKEFLDKINTLVDQNKTIAKGLTLMEERIRERISGEEEESQEPQETEVIIAPKPLPKF